MRLKYMMIRSIKTLIVLSLLLPSLLLAGTADDIADMSAATWYEISSSDLSNSGVYSGDGSVYSYSGGAFDPTRNILMVFGGGHDDSGDNGIYGFSFSTFAWSVIEATSSAADRDAGRPTSGGCTYDCSGGYLEDGAPVSNHTQELIKYHPGWDALISFAQGAPHATDNTTEGWLCYSGFDNSNSNRYLLDTSTWDYTLDDFPKDSYTGIILVDSSNNVWHFNTSSFPNDDLYEFRYSDSTWYERRTSVVSYHYGSTLSGAINDDDIAVIFGGHPVSENAQFAVWDLSDDTSVPVPLATSTTGSSIPNSEKNPGLAYDPNTDLFLTWAGDSGATAKVYALKVDTDNDFYHWYEIQPDSTNSFSPETRIFTRGPHGRWAYNDSIDAFVLSDQIDNNVQIYKLTEATTDNDFPEVTFEIPSTSASNTVPITTLTATDDTSAILGFQITTTPIPPKPWTDDWSTAPTTFDVPMAGKWDLYAWALDAFGNVSRYAVDTVEVNCTYVYVDSDCTDCQTYNPTTEACTGGSARVYDTITEAVAYVNTNNSTASSHIIAIDPDDTWTGSTNAETDPAGPCYGLSLDKTQMPLEFNHAGWATMQGKDDTLATLEWLCDSNDNSDYIWGMGATQHHSMITLDNSTVNEPNLRVEYLGITGAHYFNGTAAGIWVEPDVGDLLVKYCKFYENGNGILTSHDTDVDVTVLHSQFYNNGTYYLANGQHHNLYIGVGGTFIFMHNSSIDSYTGQLIKSRSNVNWIMYNNLIDTASAGACADKTYCSNYVIDLPYGGESYVVGNKMRISNKCNTDTFISYGREVYYTFGFDNGIDDHVNGPNDGVNFFDDSLNEYDGTYYYEITGDFTAGTGAGLIDVRRYDGGDNWQSMRESADPDTLFADNEEFTFDGVIGSFISTGPHTTKWSWATGDHAKDVYIYYNTIVSDCNLSYYTQYFLRGHYDTDDCNVDYNAAVSIHSQPTEFSWYVTSTPDLEKTFTTTNNSLLEEEDGDPGFVDIDNHDYALESTATSLINQGANPGLINGYQIIPQWQYDHTAGKANRDYNGGWDYGAYEYAGAIGAGMSHHLGSSAPASTISSSAPACTISE